MLAKFEHCMVCTSSVSLHFRRHPSSSRVVSTARLTAWLSDCNTSSRATLARDDVAGSPWGRSHPAPCARRDPVSPLVAVRVKVVGAIVLFFVVFRASRSSTWFMPSESRCVPYTSLQPWSKPLLTSSFYPLVFKLMHSRDNRRWKASRPMHNEISEYNIKREYLTYKYFNQFWQIDFLNC